MTALPSTYKEGLCRVSTIVSSVFPFEWENKKRFLMWLADDVKPAQKRWFAISEEKYMDVANSYWTAIHKGMEDYILWNKVYWWECEPEVGKYVGYGIYFLKEEKVTPIHTEHYIHVEDMYQWTIDLIAEIDGELWVLDWKSWSIAQEILGTKSSRWKYKKPYDKLKKATLQLSLYALPLWIKNIWVVELAEHWYVFHKLKIMTQEEVDIIINNYHNIWKKLE